MRVRDNLLSKETLWLTKSPSENGIAKHGKWETKFNKDQVPLMDSFGEEIHEAKQDLLRRIQKHTLLSTTVIEQSVNKHQNSLSDTLSSVISTKSLEGEIDQEALEEIENLLTNDKELKSAFERLHVSTLEDLDDKYDAAEHAEASKNINASQGELVPPENFSHVVGEIYRSSFPRPENFEFLAKKLKLKSILVLIPEEYPQENLDFLQQNGISLFQVGMSGNKEPFVNVPADLLTKALTVALNPENHPLLMHCNRGKHRTGCIVGCIRKLQSWSLTMIFDEYRRFAFPKARPLDQQFIEMYDETEITDIATKEQWLPISW